MKPVLTTSIFYGLLLAMVLAENAAAEIVVGDPSVSCPTVQTG